VEEEEEYEEEDERSKTIRCSSLNDIKFNSPLFIRIRQAFD
jgi:hypothetical protein